MGVYLDIVKQDSATAMGRGRKEGWGHSVSKLLSIKLKKQFVLEMVLLFWGMLLNRPIIV